MNVADLIRSEILPTSDNNLHSSCRSKLEDLLYRLQRNASDRSISNRLVYLGRAVARAPSIVPITDRYGTPFSKEKVESFISQLPEVEQLAEKLDYSDGQLKVYLPPITVEGQGNTFYLSHEIRDLGIMLNIQGFFEGRLNCTAFSTSVRSDKFHPHVDADGSICYGSFHNTLRDYAKDQELAALVSTIIALLESYNCHDPHRLLERFMGLNECGCYENFVQPGYDYCYECRPDLYDEEPSNEPPVASAGGFL